MSVQLQANTHQVSELDKDLGKRTLAKYYSGCLDKIAKDSVISLTKYIYFVLRSLFQVPLVHKFCLLPLHPNKLVDNHQKVSG